MAVTAALIPIIDMDIFLVLFTFMGSFVYIAGIPRRHFWAGGSKELLVFFLFM